MASNMDTVGTFEMAITLAEVSCNDLLHCLVTLPTKGAQKPSGPMLCLWEKINEYQKIPGSTPGLGNL